MFFLIVTFADSKKKTNSLPNDEMGRNTVIKLGKSIVKEITECHGMRFVVKKVNRRQVTGSFCNLGPAIER